MEFIATPIKDLLVLKTKVFKDERGYFLEAYKENIFKSKGLCTSWAQDNTSFSKKGVLRGLHFQKAPHAQVKLVRVVQGRAFDVAVDLRAASPTYGKHHSIELSADNALALYIPEGFAHGFQSLEDNTVLTYKCSALYAPEAESGIRWDDADLKIAWPLKEKVSVSSKDADLPSFREFNT